MSASLVSVVVPTLNAARYLREGLDSVAAQTYPDWEVVLVDGGSTDKTVEIAREYDRVRILHQSSDGLPAAWNEGVEAADGGLIAFLDSDDLWEPEKLSRQVAALTASPELEAVIARIRLVLEPGFPVPPGFRPELVDAERDAKFPSALLVRRELFDQIGVFDTRWAIASDVDWFARAKAAGVAIGVVPEVLVRKRFHDTNLSTLGGAEVNRELLEVMRASVHRGRQSS